MPLMCKSTQPIRMRQANKTIRGFHTRLAATLCINTSHKIKALPPHKMLSTTSSQKSERIHINVAVDRRVNKTSKRLHKPHEPRTTVPPELQTGNTGS